VSASQVPVGVGGHAVISSTPTGLLSLWVPKADEWINSNMRLHRMVKANRVKAWREAAQAAAPIGVTFDQPVRIEAHIYKPRRGRYDPNNLAGTTKACVDGFVSAGLLKDDDWNHVIGPDHRHGGIGPAGIIFLFTQLLPITVLTQ
jgi:crossover junction endodeoxyribonuclease RusA